MPVDRPGLWATAPSLPPERAGGGVLSGTGVGCTGCRVPAAGGRAVPFLPNARLRLKAMSTSRHGDRVTAVGAQVLSDDGRDGHVGRLARPEAEVVRHQLHARLLDVLRSEEHTSELQSRFDLVCRLLL